MGGGGEDRPAGDLCWRVCSASVGRAGASRLGLLRRGHWAAVRQAGSHHTAPHEELGVPVKAALPLQAGKDLRRGLWDGWGDTGVESDGPAGQRWQPETWTIGPTAAWGDASGIPGGGTGGDRGKGYRRTGQSGELADGRGPPGGGELSGRTRPSCRGRGATAHLCRLWRGEGLLPGGVEAEKACLSDMTPETVPCLSVFLGGRVLSVI